jgi:hypothetical protein
MTNRPGLKPQGWFDLPKASRIANALYPNLADEATKQEMRQIIKATEPQKLKQFEARIANQGKQTWKGT